MTTNLRTISNLGIIIQTGIGSPSHNAVVNTLYRDLDTNFEYLSLGGSDWILKESISIIETADYLKTTQILATGMFIIQIKYPRPIGSNPIWNIELFSQQQGYIKFDEVVDIVLEGSSNTGPSIIFPRFYDEEAPATFGISGSSGGEGSKFTWIETVNSLVYDSSNNRFIDMNSAPIIVTIDNASTVSTNNKRLLTIKGQIYR